MTQLY